MEIKNFAGLKAEVENEIRALKGNPYRSDLYSVYMDSETGEWYAVREAVEDHEPVMDGHDQLLFRLKENELSQTDEDWFEEIEMVIDMGTIRDRLRQLGVEVRE